MRDCLLLRRWANLGDVMRGLCCGGPWLERTLGWGQTGSLEQACLGPSSGTSALPQQSLPVGELAFCTKPLLSPTSHTPLPHLPSLIRLVLGTWVGWLRHGVLAAWWFVSLCRFPGQDGCWTFLHCHDTLLLYFTHSLSCLTCFAFTLPLF